MGKVRLKQATFITFSFVMMLGLLFSKGVQTVEASDGDVVIDETTFPDELFRKYVSIHIDRDQNGILSKEERDAVDSLQIIPSDIEGGVSDGVMITSMKGIEYFKNLKRLSISSGCSNLDELDVSKNTLLESLTVCGTVWRKQNLKKLDLTNNRVLRFLDCSWCQLRMLDLKNCSELVKIYCSYNDLETIDISNNKKLEELNCVGLKSLDISHNPNLRRLSCHDFVTMGLHYKKLDSRGLETLDISGNTCFQNAYSNSKESPEYIDKECRCAEELESGEVIPGIYENGILYKGYYSDSEWFSVGPQTILTGVDSGTTNQISSCKINRITSQVYTGSIITPEITVIDDNNRALKRNVDYKVEYSNNIKVGTATVTITGIGEYAGTTTCTFQISRKKMSACTFTIPTARAYTGSKVTPAVSVKDGTKALKNGTDYTVTCSNNINVGKATIKITGKGNYSGTITKTFKINPRPTTVSSVTAGSKRFIVKWKKATAKNATGYQIQYSKKADFSSGNKTTNVTKVTTVSKAVTKLTKGNYYVRVRTYKLVNGTKYFSTWSAKKKVVVK